MSRQQVQREDARFRLLRALGGNPGFSQRGLAREIGVSLGAVNALLNAMIEAGLVKIRNSETAPGRFRFAYALTAEGRGATARLAGQFLARRRAELTALQREIDALSADLADTSEPPA